MALLHELRAIIPVIEAKYMYAVECEVSGYPALNLPEPD